MDGQNYTPGGSPQGIPQVPTSPAFTTAPTLAQAQKPKNNLLEIAILISISLIAAISIGLLVWVYTQWQDVQTDVDGRINIAVAEAVDEQRTIDEANFAAREKLPNLEFTGPDDYGRLSFLYPRTWSVFVTKDAGKGGDYEAYFNPGLVPPTSASPTNRFALRVIIYDRPYTDVLKTFDSLVNSRPPKLTSSVFQVGDNTGTRLDGAFNNDITGSAILLKINDKTVFIRTDTEEGRPDFETLIQTIKFN